MFEVWSSVETETLTQSQNLCKIKLFIYPIINIKLNDSQPT